MQFRLDHAVDILRRTPGTLRHMLAGIDGPWVMNNYGEATFSPFDVVGHLIHGEKADWLSRAQIILDHGEARPFEPFDRYAMHDDSKGKTMADLLDEFEMRRAANLRELESLGLTEDQFAMTGMHPALGRITLGQLLATWVTHDLHHIAQICKSMAFQYKTEVGPWLEYIGIIPR
jgi:uncharacterized damage-inducible protein DinB